MDVKSVFSAIVFLLLLANCDQRSPSSDNQFTKTGTPGCDDSIYSGEYLVHWKDGRVTVERSENDQAFIDEFVEVHRDEIIMSEPHYRIQLEESVQSSSSPWGGYPNWGYDAIGASQLQDQVSDQEIRVAVIDSGVDINHPELVDAIAVNAAEEVNGIDDDGNGYVDDIKGYDFVNGSPDVVDYTGHGTHVAGTIAAQHNTGSVLGVAPNVKIVPIAFLSRSGGGSVSAAIGSIRYAVDQKVKVINASWGGPSCSSVLQSEIKALAKEDILFVTAAGNSGNNLLELPEYPAAFDIDNMLTVGATAYTEDCSSGDCFVQEITASFSNFGEPVDLMGPGAAITSTYPPEFDTDKDLDGVATINGTSMATPHVAGAAALLWSIMPGASYGQIKQALLDGVQPGPFRVKSRGSLYLPSALNRLRD